MTGAVPFLIIATLAYLAGSLPFGLLVGKLFHGIDIRTAGSKNIGATNAGRVLGAKWGVFVLLLDALKGLLPVLLLPMLLLLISSGKKGEADFNHASVLCGFCTIIGHMFPVWLKFKGGKGVATTLGIISVLSPLGLLIATVVFWVVFGLFRIVSLCSILAAISFGACQLWLLRPHPFSSENWSLALLSLLVPLLIIIRHRSNIVRLFKGEEPRFQSASKVTKNDN